MRQGLFLIPIFLGLRAAALEGMTIPVNPFSMPSMPFDAEIEASVTCTSFSGTWAGSCDSAEGKKELAWVLVQEGCARLRVNGTPYPIEGMESTSVHQGGEMVTGNTVLAWDRDKTQMLGHVQSMGQLLAKKRNNRYQYKNKFVMERRGSVLLITNEYQADVFVNDAKRVDKGEWNCRLEKKAEPLE